MEFAYKGKKMHFVGAGGVSMSGLMRLCREKGAVVSGSDRQDSPTLQALRQDGMAVYAGNNPRAAGEADVVVYTAAIPPDDPERTAAKRQVERSELLGHIAGLFPTVVAVAGTHGKTTVCGMLTHILQVAGMPHTAHIGGDVPHTLSGTYIGGDQLFLTEACEYRRHFLTLKPTLGVVTNIEHDHPDCYADLDDVYRAFTEFGKRCDSLLSPDQRLICSLAHTSTCTYGDISIRPVCMHPDTYQLSFMHWKIRFSTGVWGQFNVQNAAIAASAALLLHVEPAAIAEGLATFEGVGRRQQVLGNVHGMPIISDYAHHPTEIAALLQGARSEYGNIMVVFQPHTYSRTLALLADFATCFACDELLLLPTYAAREEAQPQVDRVLFDAIRCADKKAVDKQQALEIIQKTPHKKYGALLFVGAGNVHEFAKQVAALEPK